MNPPSSTALAPAFIEPPPLKIKKLKPRFHLAYYGQLKPGGPTDKSVKIARGITRLDDAVRMAWALAEARNGMEGNIHIWARHGTGVYGDNWIPGSVSCVERHRKATSVRETIADVERSIAKKAERAAVGEQRSAWLTANLGEFSSPRVQALWSDEVFRAIYFSSRFRDAFARALSLESERQVAA